ncbi:MAG: DUF6263 family protein [Phycisphaerales bacterium JB040]
MHSKLWRMAGWCLSAMLGIAVGSASAQPTFELRPRWDSETPTRYRVDEEMTQEISGEASTTLFWKRALEYTERVVERDRETGVTTVERTYDSVEVAVEGDGIDDARYDSNDPRTADAKSHPLVGPFAALEGQAVRFTVDDEGNVLEASGADAAWGAMLSSLAGGLGKGSGLGQALSGGLPSEEALRRQIEGGLRALPEDPVRVRDTWEQRTGHATPLGTVTSELSHRLGGFRGRGEGRLARIETSGRLVSGGGDESGLGNLLQGLAGVSVALGETSIRGESLFDVAHGQFVRQEMVVQTEWVTQLGEGMEELGLENRQRITQRSVLERLD